MVVGQREYSILIYWTKLQLSPFRKTALTDAARVRDSEPSVKLSMYGEGEWEGDEEAAVVAPMAARYDNASRLDLSECL